MTTIVISLLPDGAIPVDKYEEDEDGKSCPLPTQDPELNDKNRQMAVDEHGYREAGSGSSFRADKTCGSCGMYNQTEEMMDCIEDESGETGYCQLLKFVCMRENTCDDWVEGGPITSSMQKEYGEYL